MAFHQAQKFPGTPMLALTATATEQVRRDVVSILRLSNAPLFTVPPLPVPRNQSLHLAAHA